MRSIITGIAICFLAIYTFLTMANIQYQANAAIEIETAANEATYSTISSSVEETKIKSDDDMINMFIKLANQQLANSKSITSPESK